MIAEKSSGIVFGHRKKLQGISSTFFSEKKIFNEPSGRSLFREKSIQSKNQHLQELLQINQEAIQDLS